MTPLLEVPLAEGGSVLVEVDDSAGGPAVRAPRGAGDTLPPTDEPLAPLLAGLGPATRAVFGQLRPLVHLPHEIEVDFAVKLSADAGLIIDRPTTPWARRRGPRT